MMHSDPKNFPRCNATNCFACMNIVGTYRCVALNDTNFKDRACPFYKSRERAKEERKLYPVPEHYRRV